MPRTITILVHYVLFPFFSLKIPKEDEQISHTDYTEMFTEAIQGRPEKKKEAAADVVFLMNMEQRQGSTGFAAACAGAVYGAAVDLKWRHPIHLAGIVICFGLVLSHLIHVVNPNKFVTWHGKLLALSFGPLFVIGGVANILGFIAAREAAGLDS